MTGNELTRRVTRESGAAVVAAALVAAWLGGAPACAGVAAGGALALVNFRWLARGAVVAAAAMAGGRPGVGWMLAVGVRHLATFGALAALLLTGWVEPLALMAGLTVLPCVLIARGLAAARGAA